MDLYEAARQVCADQGIDCPDPGNHILLPDGTAGPHAWVIQSIKDARGAE